MKKLLIIEDDKVVLENIRELLESEEQYEVFTAPDGSHGIEYAKKYLPDLIICDIMMPDLSGYEVLRTLKNDPATSTIPFIFLSARTDKSDQRLGMELGADDYLTKPFSANEIFKAIDVRLTKKEEIESKTEDKLNELRLSIASSLPHELRTPLNGILASAQLLIEYYDNMEREEIFQIHNSIYTSAKRLNRLIMNYLTFAELELISNDEKRLESFRKASITKNAAMLITDLFTKTAANYKRENDLNFDIEDASIMIFDEHLKKLCEEIADNTFKFSNPNSNIIVSGIKKQDKYIISVKDFGRGMSLDQISRIGAYVQFDRNFYEQQGSGLGLIIVKKLLDIYRGNIKFESKINEYTIAQFEIPLAEH